MKSKQLYELNLPPAAFFIGQHVRVVTRMEERDETGEPVGVLTVVGTIVESDSVYLTLGTFSELEQSPIPMMAIKHDDIQMIRVVDPNEMDLSLQNPDSTLN